MRLQKFILSVAFLVLPVIVLAQKNDVYISGDSLIKLGIEQYYGEKYEEALKYYSEVNPNDKDYPLSLYNKALTYSVMDKKEEALQELKLMQKYANSLDYDYYNLLGSVLDNLDRREEAMKMFESVYSRYEHTFLIPYNCAVTYYRDGKLDKARTILEKNVRINPYHFNSHIALGKIHYAQGRLVPALLCFAYASTINDSSQAGYIAYNYFDQALNGELGESIKKESGLDAAGSAGDEINQPFKELEYMLMNYFAGNTNFVLKAKIDYKTTRQLQFLIENIKTDSGKTDVLNQQYIPFFNQLVESGQMTPYIYFFVRFSENKDVVKQINKNKNPIEKYIEWVVQTVNKGREKLFDPKSTIYYTFNQSGIESEGGYSDVQDNVERGNWIFYHNNGEKRAEGVLVNGEKDGVWTYYNENGNLKTKEIYKGGLVEGELVAYNSNGTLAQKSNYRNNKEEGESLYFNYAGFPLSKMTMKDDEIEGLYTFYYDNGSVCYTIEYDKGKRNGAYTVFYENNTLKKTSFYKNDELDGAATFYYANGEKWSVENYKNGKAVGLQQTWYSNGKLKKDYTTNEAEKITGIYKEFHSNGQLSDSLIYNKDGIPQGTGYFFDRDGKLHYTTLYNSKGKWEKVTFYDKSGKEVGSGKKEKNMLNLQLLNPEGQLVCKGQYKDDEAEGIFEYYDFYGNLTEKRNYKDGEIDGERIFFYGQTGKICQKSLYKDGKRNGFYTQYYVNGNINSQGYFVDGEKEGEWKTFYPDGQLSAVNFYREGKYQGVQNYYSSEGKKSREEFYENKVMTRLAYYDAEEEILDSCRFTNGYGKLLLKYPDGKTYRECQSIKGGEYNGEFTVYNVKGDITSQSFLIAGMYNGKRILYNDDKEKTREENYLLNNLHGKTTYYQNGKLSCEIEYFMDVPVVRTDYYPNGKKSFECSFNDYEEREGWASVYSESGELQYKLLYKRGELTGFGYLDKDGSEVEKQLTKGMNKITAYYQNGNKSLEATITGGWREGSYTRWHPDGKVYSESNYLNNNMTGVEKKYSPEGVLTEHSFYENDHLHGLSRKYSDKGVLLSEEEYMNGYLHGTSNYYQANGKQRCTRIYNQGLLVSEK